MASGGMNYLETPGNKTTGGLSFEPSVMVWSLMLWVMWCCTLQV